jgi:hypothetical protein
VPSAQREPHLAIHIAETHRRFRRVMEMKTEGHASRISALEAHAKMICEAIFRLLRGCLALMLDQRLNAGTLLRALFAH